MSRVTSLALAIPILLAAGSAVLAQDCGNSDAGFDPWLQRFKAEAAAKGISQNAIAAGLNGVTYDPVVVRLDRSQRSFKLSFEQFYARRAGPGLVRRAQSMLQTHRATLDRVEKRYGVPREVLVAIWGLETNFGADSSGKYSIVRSLATLAYDCRRSAFFRMQLLDALRIIQRGDLTPAQMRGGWAGEIGHVQFLPTPYIKYAVDFDGDGRRDLSRSVPDMLASTANYLQGHGWKAGQPWGPGTGNYAVLREWNRAEVYQRTIAVMSMQLRQGT